MSSDADADRQQVEIRALTLEVGLQQRVEGDEVGRHAVVGVDDAPHFALRIHPGHVDAVHVVRVRPQYVVLDTDIQTPHTDTTHTHHTQTPHTDTTHTDTTHTPHTDTTHTHHTHTPHTHTTHTPHTHTHHTHTTHTHTPHTLSLIHI